MIGHFNGTTALDTGARSIEWKKWLEIGLWMRKNGISLPMDNFACEKNSSSKPYINR